VSPSGLADLQVDRSAGGIMFATVRGEIDDSNAAELGRTITAQVASADRMLAVDLTHVSYMDSTGVELLFGLARQLQARRQSLIVVVPPRSGVRRVLELCDIGSAARLVSARDDVAAHDGG
jgi:anti-anti-sigma factor